jgi:hypothetical protein
MGRSTKAVEARREFVEGDLAALGNARVCLRLVYERIIVSAAVIGRPDILLPALQDLKQADTLIYSVQVRIKRFEQVDQ